LTDAQTALSPVNKASSSTGSGIPWGGVSGGAGGGVALIVLVVIAWCWCRGCGCCSGPVRDDDRQDEAQDEAYRWRGQHEKIIDEENRWS
jgi:hypothetical protein